MNPRSFDELSQAYEAMIDWPKRLANEAPFYRRVAESLGARRLLDSACGTGRHATMFHSWGMEVEAADISPGMIDHCIATYGEPVGLRWVVRSFEEPVDSPGTFDMAVCVGNSLALAADPMRIERAARNLLSAVRPGGAAVIHLMNLWRLRDGEVVWQKCRRSTVGQSDSLIIKGVRRCGRTGFVEMLVTDLSASQPTLRAESVPFAGLERQDLIDLAVRSGAGRTKIHGSYREDVYEASTSQDMILVAFKAM